MALVIFNRGHKVEASNRLLAGTCSGDVEVDSMSAWVLKLKTCNAFRGAPQTRDASRTVHPAKLPHLTE